MNQRITVAVTVVVLICKGRRRRKGGENAISIWMINSSYSYRENLLSHLLNHTETKGGTERGEPPLHLHLHTLLCFINHSVA